jgi:glutathione peroxidase-family protein
MRLRRRLLAAGIGLALTASVILAQEKAGQPRGGRPRDARPRAGALGVGDAAPDFTLASLDGKRKVTLSDYRGQRPVALIFGSYTWPPFRHQVGALEAMYARYRGEVQFFVVYIREAHPTDGWQVPQNVREQILFVQPKQFDDRRQVARQMCSVLKLSLPTVIDNLDDKVNQAYAAWPDRLYLVDRDGKIAFKSKPGPWGFKPGELEAAIKRSLAKSPDTNWKNRVSLRVARRFFPDGW